MSLDGDTEDQFDKGEGDWPRSDAEVMSNQLRAMIDLKHPTKVAAAEFAETALSGKTDSFDMDRWRASAAFGVQGLRIPEAFGGAGRSTVDALLTFEGLGYGTTDNGLVFALAAQSFAMQTSLIEAGSDEQKRAWLPKLASGEAIGAFAMSERDAGSDAASISMTAEEQPDGRFRLDGEKAWVTLGPVADVIVLFAVTDPTIGRWGISAFLVPTSTPGCERGEIELKGGLNSCPSGFSRFDGCFVGPDALLGRKGAGMAIFSSAVEAERAFLYAGQLGTMERLIDRSVQRVREREQFGKPIGSFQAVSHRIAEMKRRHETARLLVYKAGVQYDRGEPVTLVAALAKIEASEAMVEAAVDTLRLHGAEGYTAASGLDTEVIDALGGLAYSGTADIQRNIVASLLKTDRPVRNRRSKDS